MQMTPRKKPQCHTCDAPMEGHKRPNGYPVCPSKPSKSMSGTPEPEGVFPRKIYHHYVNPNFIGDPASPLPSARRGPDRTDTPYSWVSTELADDTSVPPPTKQERMLKPVNIAGPSTLAAAPDVEITGTSPSPSSSASTSTTSSRLRRTFNSLLHNSMPVVSLFSAPRDDVPTITQAARKNGLYTGVMRQPTRVKEEGESSASRPIRRNSWYVLLGRDPTAVEHLMDLQEQSTLGRIGSDTNKTQTVTIAPQEIRVSMGNFQILFCFQMVFCTVLGALAMAFILSVV